MGNKRHSKAVITTIIVTVIVLAVLSVVGIRYLMPTYVQEQGADADIQYTIYKFAVRLFPLLVGIVLIIIASMIASSRNDQEDEEDLLPPNSYDDQLFEAPSDDPVEKTATRAKTESKKQEPKEEEIVSDSISDDEFFEIFSNPDDKKPETIEPESSDDEIAALFYGDDNEEESASEDEIKSVPEAEAQEEASEEVPEEAESDVEPQTDVEPVAEKPVETEAVQPAPSSSDGKLVDAVYALVRKLDEMTDLITYEEDEEDEYEEEEEPEEEQFEPVSEQPAENYSSLERKIDKLCDSIALLTQLVSANAIASSKPVKAAPAPAAAPTPTPVPAPAPEPVRAPEPEIKAETEKEEDPANQQINDYDPTNPMHLMKIEFDSAQEDQYDITFAFTKSNAGQIRASLAEVADVFEVNGKTIVVIPFLTDKEAQDELSSAGIDFYNKIHVEGGEKAQFDSLIAPSIA